MRQIENTGIWQAKKLSLGFLSISPLQSQGCTSSKVRVGNQLFVAAELSAVVHSLPKEERGGEQIKDIFLKHEL